MLTWKNRKLKKGKAKNMGYHGVPYGTVWYLMVPYGTIWYHMVPSGTIRYHMVPCGTIWYHKVPHGTIRYHMVPYGTIWSPPWGGARRCWDAKTFSDSWPLKKKVIFYIKKSEKSSKLIKYKGILTFWRLEKNPHEMFVILVQKSLKTDNSESSYDTFWFWDGYPWSTMDIHG